MISVEPEKIPAMSRALADGAPVEVEVERHRGRLARHEGDRKPRVPDRAEVTWRTRCSCRTKRSVRAQRALWDRVRVLAEPGGAAAMAALLSGVYRPKPGERIGVLVCGANTDPATALS